MQARRVLVSAFLTVITTTSGWAAAVLPQAVSPGRASGVETIDIPCPTFSWAGVADAAAYELAVVRLPTASAEGIAGEGEGAQPLLRKEVPGAASSWTPALDQCLEPGGSYAWAVRSVDESDHRGAWSEAVVFRIAGVPSPTEVLRALAILNAYLEAAGDAAAAPGERARPARAESIDRERPRLAGAEPAALAVAAQTALTAEVSGTTGVLFGVRGISKSTGAGSVGVAGESSAASGDVAGVYGQAASPAGAAGVFDNTASGDILRGLAGGVEVFTVDGGGGVSAQSFSGDGSGLTAVSADHADDLDCVSCVGSAELDFSAASLDTAATIAADWDNTAFPWADSEVSDALTVGAGGSVDDGALSANVSLLGQTIESSEITDGTVTAIDIADGPGSGLDADTLDGIDSTAFLEEAELDSEAELETQVGVSLVNSTETALAATSLASDGSNCPAGEWAAGVDAS